ncbi:c-type cytochrome biogenesis protein CcsB [Kitasatospora viridis]|uniref:Cytochrome c-type biogenesis protein CcsB n=1 Tax=Kitasatospora viridis TaxID=281105 RepID=A0A561UJ43_9ACTN|nr:c-type cytochrome biogenesis protein CcsB [Kitasatospora viridis]TWF99370.1 cytochrome c-type biogenesis protein CcsB [Kitasatospora viridis]
MSLASGVNPHLADLSNKCIWSAMGVYALAMFAHMFEWTFGSKGAVARRSAEQASLAEAAAAAAAPQAAKAKKVTVTVASGNGGTTTLTRTALAGEGATVVTSGRGDDDPEVDGPGAAGTSERADLFGRIAISLTVLGFLLNLGGVVFRGLSVMRPPWGNMYEFSCAFSVTMVGAYLVLLVVGKPVRWLGLPAVLAACLTLGLATSVLYTDSEQLVPALHSYWLAIHVTAAIICGGAFYAAFATTAFYLGRESYDKRKAAGLPNGPFKIPASVFERMPATATLDKLSYRINAMVFPLWTFTIIAGAIWAEAAWGKYWEWDPKETWSFITWVVYAAYLHARATAGWKGRKAGYLALLAFACFLFNYYGVNIFITGKHSYAGVG